MGAGRRNKHPIRLDPGHRWELAFWLVPSSGPSQPDRNLQAPAQPRRGLLFYSLRQPGDFRSGCARVNQRLVTQQSGYNSAAPCFPMGVKRIAIEAGAALWWKYVGLDGAVVGMDGFGESAPASALFLHFGVTAERIAETARLLVHSAHGLIQAPNWGPKRYFSTSQKF